MVTKAYPARLDIDYPPKLDRFTSFVRLIWAIPILAILFIITGTSGNSFVNDAGQQMSNNGGGIVVGLFVVTLLLIVFRQRYPRWWFNFNLELNRFTMRVTVYLLLLTDQYPSTVDAQSVHLDIDYPNVKQDLNRWLPLVKWLLALPHYIVLFVLTIGVLGAVVIAWFAILFTGRYPKSLFDFVVGVNRWDLRVTAYAILLVTDQYPPFSLK
ncbi:MAG: hypothetical protein JWN12_47 [Candidatus Saccharibacteria bacterium]|nr:hypothetical protein [Candidatus Saccharibacteria bacterium]